MRCNRYLVHITHGKENRDKITLGCMLASASAAKGLETVMLLTNEGARLGFKGYGDDIHEKGFPPVPELISSFVDLGGKIWV